MPATAPFADMKADPGPVGLASVLQELAKPQRVTALALPPNLFADMSPKRLQVFRARATAEPPRAKMRRHPAPIRYTLLAAFCWQRRQEVIDGLVDLLVVIIHRISVRAERKVIKALVQDRERVDGKTTLLYKRIIASLASRARRSPSTAWSVPTGKNS